MTLMSELPAGDTHNVIHHGAWLEKTQDPLLAWHAA
jgi:hypothetical protein